MLNKIVREFQKIANEFWTTFGVVPLLSVWNEIQAILLLKINVQKAQDRYPTTLTEDYRILKDDLDKISPNQVQAVKARIIEKLLLEWWAKFCDDIIVYWKRMSYGEFTAVANQEPYSQYEAYFDWLFATKAWKKNRVGGKEEDGQRVSKV